jgi:hypothetical protein
MFLEEDCMMLCMDQKSNLKDLARQWEDKLLDNRPYQMQHKEQVVILVEVQCAGGERG